jgi:uncharacterized protein YbjQ (UPF0145 family)
MTEKCTNLPVATSCVWYKTAVACLGALGFGAARLQRIETEALMIVSTTASIEGRTIAGYLGVVSGDAVMGTNMFRDLFAGLRDIVGGRSGAYEKELKRAKRLAIEEMVEEAEELGADAIVGVDLDYEHLGTDNRSMLMVSANGTAVKLA